jgi:biotin carboxyl carrier protein
MVLASLAIATSTAYADDVDTSSLQNEVEQLRQEVQRLNEEVKFLKETVVPVPPTAKQAEAVAQPPAQSNPTELPSASAGARPAGDSIAALYGGAPSTAWWMAVIVGSDISMSTSSRP